MKKWFRLLPLVVSADIFAQANQATQDLWNALKQAHSNSLEITVARASKDQEKIKEAFAAQEKTTAAIKAAIAAGADVDYVAPDGTSAWSQITEKNAIDAELYLVPNSKGLQKIKVNGLSPLLLLLQLKYDFTGPAVEGLLAKGANPNDRFPDGKRAIEAALAEKRLKMDSGTYSQAITALVRGGADVSKVNRDDQLLLWQCGYQEAEYYKALKQQGLSSEITDADGRTPLLLAAQKNDRRRLEALFEAGADVNATDKNGETVLMFLVRKPLRSKRMIQKLIAAGADLTLKNKKDQTAADIFHATPEAKQYTDYEENDQGESATIMELRKILPQKVKLGRQIGKVFSVDGKKIEITGDGIGKLAKGQKLVVKTAAGNVTATVSETLHTKAKANIAGKGSVQRGDAVHLAK